MQLVVEKLPLLFIICKITNAQIVSSNPKQKSHLNPKKHQTFPTKVFWSKIHGMVTKCIYVDPTIPNPHMWKVAKYKDNKKCKTFFTLGLASSKQS